MKLVLNSIIYTVLLSFSLTLMGDSDSCNLLLKQFLFPVSTQNAWHYADAEGNPNYIQTIIEENGTFLVIREFAYGFSDTAYVSCQSHTLLVKANEEEVNIDRFNYYADFELPHAKFYFIDSTSIFDKLGLQFNNVIKYYVVVNSSEEYYHYFKPGIGILEITDTYDNTIVYLSEYTIEK